MSHFTVALVLMLIGLTNAYARADVTWVRVFLVVLAVLVISICISKARKHNKPSNTSPIITTPIAIGIMGFDAGSVLFHLYHGTYITAMFLMLDIVALTLNATPGFKVPHEPDNLNYSPQGAS